MDRAPVDQLLTTTRTVRKRLDLSRPVEPAVIQRRCWGSPIDVTQVVHLGVGYYTGTAFKPGLRVPARARTYWDGWGQQR